ncbi:hypothetical protein OPQ81_003891 [Rhizoctonia solani]|nr:hypothetical protein OPQ81_003891 [Rhizoctonia solani]
MELRWYDGSPPYSVWFRRNPGDGAQPVPGLGAWFNVTTTQYVVPCIAPAGSRIELVLKDSTGWISLSRGDFVVLPSSNTSCLNETPDAVGISQSQGVLSTLLWNFQQSIISAISVSATASTASVISASLVATSVSLISASRVATSTSIPTSSSGPTSLGRILGPVLGSLLGVLLCMTIGICLIRRRRQKKPELHIPLHSASSFDLLDGERPGLGSRSETVTREVHQTAASMAHPTNATTNISPATDVPRSRLRLHDGTTTGWPSTVKNRESAVPPLPEATEQVPPPPISQQQDPRTLEQRAEQLSAPELERLAALVARRLERVRGAPPQYQATEGIGV